jgi:hypothetical protein
MIKYIDVCSDGINLMLNREQGKIYQQFLDGSINDLGIKGKNVS